MIQDFPEWLQNRPLVEQVSIEAPLPSLEDNTADLDRFTRVLIQEGFEPLLFNPCEIGRISSQMRNFGFKLKPVLGFDGHSYHVLDVLPHNSASPVLGFAVDLGTSTIVFQLIDLAGARVIATKSVINPQVRYGEDILSRILFARKQGLTPPAPSGNETQVSGLETLRRLLAQCFKEVMEEVLGEQGFSIENVYAVSCAGNTTMTHFFLGLDPANICREPYIPVANTFPIAPASEYGLDFLPRALLYVFPNVGSYVGGDIIAGIIAAGVHMSSEPAMLIDVGTNAEVVIGSSDWLLACAGAAGPALEGGVVERGMQAMPGAIDRVRIDPRTKEPSFTVLGGRKPIGLCGSGLIDLIAEMFAAGILTVQGKLDSASDPGRIVDTPDGRAYVLVPADMTGDGSDLRISEIDIGIFLKSKAAMYTILSVISGKVGLTFKDIGKISIAGNFGNHIDPRMAVRIGMVPDLPLDVYQGIGNSSVLGATMALLDRTLLDEAERIRGRITYVELNVNLELMNEFRGALFLPHTNRRLFPSVRFPTGAVRGSGA